jgi:hypothetical protein
MKFKPMANKTIKTLMILLSLIMAVVILTFMIRLWPDGSKVTLCGYALSPEKQLIVLVALGGALGAFVHMSTSLVDYIGAKKLMSQWIPWYLMRPFIGAALAVIFYLLILGGIVNPYANQNTASTSETNTEISIPDESSAQPLEYSDSISGDSLGSDSSVVMMHDTPVATEENKTEISVAEEEKIPQQGQMPPVNPYGILAIACMSGMFSKHAIDKLKEVFEGLFRLKEKKTLPNSLDEDPSNDA